MIKFGSRSTEAMLVVVAALAASGICNSQVPSASKGIRWDFNESHGALVHDSLGNLDDHVEGYFDMVPGVEGNALHFDGYTTRIVRKAKEVPALGDAFTVSAWVALDNYPWNWVPIVDQSDGNQVGFFFGIDAFGHLGLQLSVNGVWQQVTSAERLQLKKWAFVACTFDPKTGLTLYLDGKPAGQLHAEGSFVQARDVDLLIGRVRTPQLPFPGWLSHPQDPFKYSLDGYVDQLEIAPRARPAEEIEAAATSVNVPDKEVIPYAVLPAGEPGAGPFGASYETLKFTQTWDRPRRIGPDSDVVVRFDQAPVRLVFWQGTNYVPSWVTENGKWYCEQFIETWGPPACTGGEDCEPMSDKQSRYSHVAVVESSPARAVVHWRYALAETRNYSGANADPDTGWFDWADEYWTVYPDGVAVRKQILWGPVVKPEDYEWQETIVINGPNQKPEDNIEMDALTLANMQGATHTYHWNPKVDENFDLPRGPAKLNLPPEANIQVVNLKSKWKPFEIVHPGNVHFHVYGSEPSYSMFEWWDHWPVAQVPSSGRPAIAPDRPSHTSLSDIYWDDFERTDHNETKIMMTGLTPEQPEELVTLGKSWLSPPMIRATGQTVTAAEYDSTQRAFVIHRSAAKGQSTVTCTLDANANSPLVNPAFVVENWSGNARVLVNGKPLPEDHAARTGNVTHTKSTDLILWLPLKAQDKVEIRVEPAT